MKLLFVGLVLRMREPFLAGSRPSQYVTSPYVATLPGHPCLGKHSEYQQERECKPTHHTDLLAHISSMSVVITAYAGVEITHS